MDFLLDKKQATDHLTFLGFKVTDPIFFRFFYGSNNPKKNNDSGRKTDFFSATVIEKYQKEGRGTYIVVNGGGHTDSEVKNGRAIFCEHDHLDKEIQLNLWRGLNLPEPTFQVDTGGKSIHSYWVFSNPIPIDSWRELQADLLDYTDADKSIKNPSRVMRLAGAWHIDYQDGQLVANQSKIVTASSQQYDFQVLREAIPASVQKSTPLLSIQENANDSVPLINFLTKDDRALITQGCTEGNRNTNGAKLARNLIGTALRLDFLGISYSDRPYDLFIEYCQKCPSGNWNQREWDLLWRKAETSNPTPTLSDDALKNCQKAYLRNQAKPGKPLKVVTPPPLEEPEETTKQLNFTQQAYFELYNGHYISINDKLYHFEKTHYVPCNEGLEKRRITRWCEAYSSKKSEKRYIQNVWEWVLLKTAVNPDVVNPPGLNLLNGTLKITWKGLKPSWQLHKHNPEEIYTYVSEVTFKSEVNSENCDRLLACLDVPQQQIFLRTLAASLDLPKVREHRGREVKAILCKGTGSNGKDALREAVRTLFDNAMTAISLGDFSSYDAGRKFPLAKLHGALISWSSENASLNRLDSVQSLKAAITGESIDIEIKNQPEFSIFPQSIFLFNCNDAPRLKGSQQAIIDRWAILSFEKTFKINADPSKGELEADSRFRYDPTFIKNEVAPALLNKILLELNDLLITGIDYKPVEQNFESLKRESNHLFNFADDVGLTICPDGKVYINDLWDLLKQWYMGNGTLEVEETDKGKPKLIWHEQVNKGDRNVRAVNQIRQRFSELFPGITWGKETTNQDKRGQAFLQGIAINPDCKTADQMPFETIKAAFPTIIKQSSYTELCEIFELLSIELEVWEQKIIPIQQQMLEIADSVNPEKEKLSALKEQFPKPYIVNAWNLIKVNYPEKYQKLVRICK